MAKIKDENLEIKVAGIIFIIGLLLRILYIFQYHFDTDEPQHLHVVWAWTRGLLQYRDIFDNHSPMFHILCAPVLYAIGERATVLFSMRLAMVPLFLIAMFCTYIIGRNLFSKRAGIWSIALISIYPAFLYCSFQFRSDILWMVFWLAGLSVITGRTLTPKSHDYVAVPPVFHHSAEYRESYVSKFGEISGLTPKRFFLAGLFFGLALCTSLKTILLLFSLIIAVILSRLTGIRRHKSCSWRIKSVFIIPALLGFLIMPVIIIAFFASQKALDSLFYCTVRHNILPGIGHWQETWRIILFLILLPVLFWINRKLFYGSKKRYLYITHISIMFLGVGIYFLSLFSFWPVVTKQDFLPVYSLIALLIIPKMLEWIDRSKFSPVIFLIFISAFEIIVIFLVSRPWINQTGVAINNLSEVIKLTDKNDWVIDQKGETIFRPRPYYYIFETFTRERFSRGLIPDDIAEHLIDKRCCVATNSISRFPQDARKFLWENYISIGHMRVAGKLLEPTAERRNVYKFSVRIPARYVIIRENGEIKGALDGSPYTGARFLEAGPHQFISDTDVKEIAVIWAQASERGFSPFKI